MIKGRPSKILQYGIIEDVERLRDSGLSYQAIAEEISSHLPRNQSISKDVVSRYFMGKTKQLHNLQSKPDIIESIQSIFRNIRFNIDKLKSLDKADTKAIKSYLKDCQRVIETKLDRYYRGYEEEYSQSELDRVREFILQCSLAFCPECRRRLVSEVLKLESESNISR